MELDEKSLGIFLYMYSMKDDVLGFKQILSKINAKNNESVLRLAFSNACERNSFTVVNYILESPEYDFLNKNDYEGNITAISHRKNSELMKILLTNEKVLSKINIDTKLCYKVLQIRNKTKSLEIIKSLFDKDLLNMKDHGDDLFLFASDTSHKELIKYLFKNEKEVLPIETLKNIILTKEENMVEIFLDLISEFNIKFNEVEKSYINENKKELYNILSKKELFEKLENKLEEKPKQLKAKI